MSYKLIKLFLRLAIATAFLSAVADRLGLWGQSNSVWGSWDSFLQYTAQINPWAPAVIVPALGLLATVAEIVLALGLIAGYKTKLFANLSGILLLIFALSMTFSTGIKKALDASVFSASAAAFALGIMKEKYWELDAIIERRQRK